MEASLGLDADRSVLYFDLVLASLSEAARKGLQAMDPAKYEFQSEFARRYLSQGRAEGHAEGEAKGRAEGRAEGAGRVLLKQLTLKFGPLQDSVVARLQTASLEELELWTERILSASTLEDVFR
jgi:predicted transposase YdaD